MYLKTQSVLYPLDLVRSLLGPFRNVQYVRNLNNIIRADKENN